jgi:hypothetical protein
VGWIHSGGHHLGAAEHPVDFSGDDRGVLACSVAVPVVGESADGAGSNIQRGEFQIYWGGSVIVVHRRAVELDVDARGQSVQVLQAVVVGHLCDRGIVRHRLGAFAESDD